MAPRGRAPPSLALPVLAARRRFARRAAASAVLVVLPEVDLAAVGAIVVAVGEVRGTRAERAGGAHAGGRSVGQRTMARAGAVGKHGRRAAARRRRGGAAPAAAVSDVREGTRTERRESEGHRQHGTPGSSREPGLQGGACQRGPRTVIVQVTMARYHGAHRGGDLPPCSAAPWFGSSASGLGGRAPPGSPRRQSQGVQQMVRVCSAEAAPTGAPPPGVQGAEP